MINHSDQLAQQKYELNACQLSLHDLYRIEDADFIEMFRSAKSALKHLKRCPSAAYARHLINKGSWENARGVLRELIRDFSPRSDT